MSTENFHLGAYWGARAESPREIAERAASTLTQMGACHPLLRQWNELADTLAEALRRIVEPTAEVIEPLLGAIEPVGQTNLGYLLCLWNGREELAEQCSLSVNSGIVQTHPAGFANHVVLELPGDPDVVPDLHSPEVMLRLLRIFAQVWRPDSGIVMSDRYMERHVWPGDELPTPGEPVVGWMTYLRRERLAELPERVPCRTVDVDGLGTIFVVADDHRFSADNPEDVAAALELTEFLQRHGALRVIPTNLPA
jgi:hypothetical protein